MNPNNPYQPQPTPQPAPTEQPYGYQPAPEPGTVAQQYPVDYLNKIATKQPVKKASPMIIFGLIGGVIIAAAIALFMIVRLSAPPDASSQSYALKARLDTLAKITEGQTKHLTQNELSSINSVLKTTLTTVKTSFDSTMTARGLKPATQPPEIKAKEKAYYDKLSQKLNDAYLTGTLDRTYASEMAYELTVVKSKMESLKVATKSSKSYNDFYTEHMGSIDTVAERLSNFQSTK